MVLNQRYWWHDGAEPAVLVTKCWTSGISDTMVLNQRYQQQDGAELAVSVKGWCWTRGISDMMVMNQRYRWQDGAGPAVSVTQWCGTRGIGDRMVLDQRYGTYRRYQRYYQKTFGLWKWEGRKIRDYGLLNCMLVGFVTSLNITVLSAQL